MANTPYKIETDENGVRVIVDTRTGKKTPVNEVVERGAKEGRLVTMEQAMANEHKKMLKNDSATSRKSKEGT
ncbi:MAG: hypothetical protein IJC98_02040 [Clostridia bacterium]|nr:hypothetical protein [Clostridia bacterium]